MKIKLFDKEYVVSMQLDRYFDGSRAILLTTNEGPFGKLTVHVPDTVLGVSEIIVKTWTENVWAKSLLLDYPEVFQDTGRRVAVGYIMAEIWTINLEKAHEMGFVH